MSGCAYPFSVSVYNGLDNTFTLALSNAAGGYMTDLSSITRVTITIGDTTIDSDVVGSSVIWWTDTASFRGETVGVVTLLLGHQGLTAGEYADCILIVYDATADDGIRFTPAFKVTVV